MPSVALEQPLQPFNNEADGGLDLNLKNGLNKNELKQEPLRETKAELESENTKRRKGTNGLWSAAPIGVPSIPSSILTPICHPLVKEATQDVDDYYLQHWPFPDAKSRKRFVAAGFSRVTCLYFPKALNERIRFACSLLTILFLIDG